MPRSIHPALVSLVSALTVSTAAHAGGATFQGLGDLPGGDFQSRSYGISPDGSVVVGFGKTESGTRAFRWTQSTGIVELTGAPANSSFSSAHAASLDGDVIVGMVFVDSAYRAFRWSQDTGMTLLDGGTVVGMVVSEAFAVSHDGNVIAGELATGTDVKAAVWFGNGTMTTIDIVNGYSGIAEGVSANGQIVAGSSPRGGIWEIPFRWTQETGVAFIEPAPVTSIEFFATEISANGTTLVGARLFSTYRAFRWNVETGTVLLGNTQFGSTNCWAYDVTADGSKVVGFDKFAPGRVEAAVWDQQGNSREVRAILVDDYGLDLTGWTLYEASGIADDGSAITGYGRNPDGHPEAWVATLPASACGCPGDVNTDGTIDAADIPSFIDCLVNGTGDCFCANTDGLGDVTSNDVAYFISTLLNPAACP